MAEQFNGEDIVERANGVIVTKPGGTFKWYPDPEFGTAGVHVPPNEVEDTRFETTEEERSETETTEGGPPAQRRQEQPQQEQGQGEQS